MLGGIISAESGVRISPASPVDALGLGSTDLWAFPDRLNIPGCQSVVNPGNPNNYVKTNCFSSPPALPSMASECNLALSPTGQPVPGTCMNLLRNAGRNSIIGPGLADFDVSLFKNIPVKRISESFNIQFRAEFFNVLNRANFETRFDNEALFNGVGQPVAGAGQIDQTSNSQREIQFGLKANW